MARSATTSPISVDFVLQPLFGLPIRRVSVPASSFLRIPATGYQAQQAYWQLAHEPGFTAGEMINAMPYSRIGITK